MTTSATLTGLAPDPRQPGHRLVEVDRGRLASLPADLVDPLGLQVGDTLAPDVLARLRALADLTVAERAALRALARRGYARLDLRRRLVGREYSPEAVDAALGRLAARGLIDDAGFAAHYAARRAARATGPARLVTDLLRQGVDRAVAEAAVRQALEDEGIDPAAVARTAARKRARQLRHLPAPVRRRRLLAFLGRRGYGSAELRALVDELCR
ncbi:MAG TPA: RecX family transcriptional regulator [Gemmatimonadales bacterium]|nr:RecX family transcriptional regulator [Gemmatimonadales bacterium]